MTTDTNTDRRETAYSALRMAGRGLIMVMVISALFIHPAAAQTNETLACEDGPPIYGQETDVEADDSNLEVMFINDDSDTMTTTVNGQTRLEALKDAVVTFINDTDSGAALGSSSTAPPKLDIGLTTDHQAVIDAVEGLTAQDSPSPDSGEAFDIATAELNGTNATDDANKVIVYVVDGSPNGEQQARAEAETARDNGVTIYTVGIGGAIDDQYMIDVAGNESRYYQSDGGNLTEIYQDIGEDIAENVEGGETVSRSLEVETRQLYRPGETHEYTVVEVSESDNTTERESVTADANVTSSNTSILSVNEGNNTLTAFDDANASTWVRVNATYNGSEGCTNVIISQPTVENLQLVPGIWRIVAVGQDDTLFALLVATLLAVPAARFTSAFGGLAVGQLVMTIGWLAGYVGFGIAAVSLFVSLFIGLNLAANIDYTAGGGFRR